MPGIAVVTPYHTESAAVLRRCRESVRAQTVPCRHILVADGHPSRDLAREVAALHVVMPRAHGDNGNTPRAFGALVAAAEGFDAIAFLDADNWIDPEHLAVMVAGHRRSGAPLVACKRVFHDIDGAPLAIREPEEELCRHVDTSCWLVFRPAFALLRAWLMPSALSPVCDRVFLHAALRAGLAITAADWRGVHFTTRYAGHYAGAGRDPPADAKDGHALAATANAYLASPEGAAAFEAMMGFALARL